MLTRDDGMVFSHYPENPDTKLALASILTTKKEAGSSGQSVYSLLCA